MAVDGLIFDFDGIIIDTETPDFEVWQEFYRSHGLELDVSLWNNRAGVDEANDFKPGAYFERLTGMSIDADLQQELFRRYMERCEQQSVLPGVREMLEQAFGRGIKLGVASSSGRAWVERWLNHLNLRRYFHCIRTVEDVKHRKPAPDPYLSAIDCLGIPTERCIAIEDSPNGMKSALAAGLRCIAVPNTLTAQLIRPEVTLTVNSLADFDLTRLLAQF